MIFDSASKGGNGAVPMASAPGPQPQKAYVSPSLVDYGSLLELTENAGNLDLDAGGIFGTEGAGLVTPVPIPES